MYSYKGRLMYYDCYSCIQDEKFKKCMDYEASTILYASNFLQFSPFLHFSIFLHSFIPLSPPSSPLSFLALASDPMQQQKAAKQAGFWYSTLEVEYSRVECL